MRRIGLAAAFIAFYSACSGGGGERFIGTWGAPSGARLTVAKEGNKYQVRYADLSFLCEANSDTLKCGQSGDVTLSAASGHIFWGGEEYTKTSAVPAAREAANDSRDLVTREYFGGAWNVVVDLRNPADFKVRNAVLVILGTAGDSSANIVYFPEGAGPGVKGHEIHAEFVRGRLVADYFGKGNVVIEAVSGNRLALTIDPFGDQPPIRRLLFSTKR